MQVCLSALVVLGVVAMLNMLGATPESMTMPATHQMTQTDGAGHTQQPVHDTAAAPGAGSHHLAAHLPAGAPTPDGGMSMADCCGLTALCLALVAGIGALLSAHRPSAGRVVRQLPRPLTVALGRAVAPFLSVTPLQRTAVLRL